MSAAFTPIGPARRRRAGKLVALSWAGFWLGVIGLFGTPIVAVNKVTEELAAAGVLCAVGGVVGPRKALAVLSILLCAGAIAASVTMRSTPDNEAARVNERLKQELEQLVHSAGTPAPDRTPTPAAGAERTPAASACPHGELETARPRAAHMHEFHLGILEDSG